MVTAIERTRTESPQRWATALERAVSANVAYMELAGGDGAWAVSSTKDPEVGYVTTVGSCTCPAGRSGDPVCCHRALVRALLGLLPDPESVRPACRICGDKGYLLDPDGRGRPERCACPAGTIRRPAA